MNGLRASGASVLLDEGWLRFNSMRWGVSAERRELSSGNARLTTVIYRDKRGRCVLPLLNPYLPLHFDDAGAQPPRLYSLWDAMASQLAEEMASSGTHGDIAIEPGHADFRQWRWRGFDLRLAYTFQLALPSDEATWDPSPRKQARKAERAGYYCESTRDFVAVESCLRETERRQGFSHQIDATWLARLTDLCGSVFVNAYICRASDGTPAAARIILWTPGSTAIDWVAGTSTAHLKNGVTQLLLRHALADLALRGAVLFDFGGADIQSVAAAKQDWGATLVSYPSIRRHDLHSAIEAVRLGVRESTLGQRLVGPVRRIKRVLRDQ